MGWNEAVRFGRGVRNITRVGETKGGGAGWERGGMRPKKGMRGRNGIDEAREGLERGDGYYWGGRSRGTGVRGVCLSCKTLGRG